jgi:hypothetical protein
VLPHLLRHPADLTTAGSWVVGEGRLINTRTPWWPRAVINRVRHLLPPNPAVFEYGGGGSTLWLEDRGATTTTVEHDTEWARHLKTRKGPRTTLLHVPPASSGHLASDSAEGFFDDYVAAVGTGPYDLVIVDGRCRVACVVASMGSVRSGGLLLLDDSDRPKYARAHDLLDGWPAEHIRGLKMGARQVCQTSLWRRP